MTKKEKIIHFVIVAFIIGVFGVVLLRPIGGYFLARALIWPNIQREELIESFDGRYAFVQLSSPKKKICTVVVYENTKPGREVSFTLPYFNDYYVKSIEWGLNTNDLFFDDADTGLHFYRNIDDAWKNLLIWIDRDADNMPIAYHLYEYVNGNTHQIRKYGELAGDTIPDDISARIIKDLQRSDRVFMRPNYW
jgi:hypothetical protein